MSEIRVDTISEKTSANGVAIDGLTIKDGGISATTGAIVFNEASADLDFRVESNGNTNMLFVDGGNDKVGIGLADPTGTFHVKTNNAGTTMYIEDSHAGNGDGPELYLYRNSSSPANADDIGIMKFLGKNDAGQDVIYGQVKSIITDVADGQEDGKIEFYHMLNGSLAPSLQLTTAGVVINESSNDIDFRVESDGNTNMLFVNGGDNAVGIGTNVTNSRKLVIGTGGAKTSTSTHYPMNIGQTNEASSHAGLNVYFVGGASAAVRKWQFQPVENGVANDGIIEVNPNGGRFKAVQGIQLGGDTDANKLDDYEEGTWTPTLSSNATAAAYSVQVGVYTKIGRMVHVSCQVQMSDLGSFAGATINVNGLPFTSANNSVDTIGVLQLNATAIATSPDIHVRIPANNAYARLENASGATTTDNNMNANRLDTGTRVRFTAVYSI